MDIGKFNYYPKRQFTDKSFFDECCDDSFFNKEDGDKKNLQKAFSSDKNNFNMFRYNIVLKLVKNKKFMIKI